MNGSDVKRCMPVRHIYILQNQKHLWSLRPIQLTKRSMPVSPARTGRLVASGAAQGKVDTHLI